MPRFQFLAVSKQALRVLNPVLLLDFVLEV